MQREKIRHNGATPNVIPIDRPYIELKVKTLTACVHRVQCCKIPSEKKDHSVPLEEPWELGYITLALKT